MTVGRSLLDAPQSDTLPSPRGSWRRRPGLGSVVVTAVAALVGSGALAAPAGAATVPVGAYVVTFAAPPTTQDLDVIGSVAASTHGFATIPAAAVTIDPALVGLLRGLPGVVGVYPDRTFTYLDDQSAQTIHAPAVWTGPDLGYDGSGIGIGIIDAGVDGTHPDLCAAAAFCKGTPVKTVQNVDVVGKEDSTGADPVVYLPNQISTDHSSGHGSHVAGIAAGWGSASATPGKYKGVAYGANIVGFGTGEVADVFNVLGAFDWAIQHRDDYNIRVLNNSWGPGAGTPYDPGDPVNLAINAAHDAGISVVFGAGNDGPRTDALNAFCVNPDAICVAGSDNTGNMAFFSSRGIPGSPFWLPTVTAPGSNIVSVRSLTGTLTTAADASSGAVGVIDPADEPYYAIASGTSMSAPHVSGVIALMQQAAHAARGVYLTADEVKNILQNTATSMSTTSPSGLPNYQSYQQGAGEVDAAAAVAAAKAGTHTGAWADPAAYDVRPFTGTVSASVWPGLSTFDSSYTVNSGALSLDVMIDWSTYPQIVDMDVTNPAGVTKSTFLYCDPADVPNGYSAFCSSAPNQRLTFPHPAPGTWHVHVYGTVTATDTVHGLWSAAYPTGTVLPAPTTVTSLSLTAKTPVGVMGQTDALIATATDAAGNPVPNAAVTWSSSGVGRVVDTEAWTHEVGTAAANALASGPGTQTITARVGGVAASVTVTWLGVTLPTLGAPPPASNTPGDASEGGWFTAGGTSAKRTLTASASFDTSASAPGGQLRYDDKGGTRVASDTVDSFTISGSTATVSGPAAVNGTNGYRYTLTLTDNGEPGAGHDTVRLVVTKPLDPTYKLDVSGTLGGGNVQVRRR